MHTALSDVLTGRTYADMIADEIHAAGWSYGHTSYTDAQGRLIFVADAHKPGRMRCITRAETLLTAYMELRGMTATADKDAEA